MTFFLTSCGGGDEKKSSETTTDTTNTAATTTEVTPVNTITTAPQNMVIIRHKVANFAKWMVAYEGHADPTLLARIRSWAATLRGLRVAHFLR